MAIAASADAQEARRVDGRVERITDDGPAGVRGAWVVLHRVGPDAQGALDSLRTDAAGRFAFRYTTRGDTNAVYFASTVYAGVAYFTNPLRTASVSGDDALLTVFDTASAGVPIVTRGRHLIISALDTTRQRTVVEIYEIENIGERTRVANESAASWSVRLPEGATDARVGEGDVSPDAIAVANGLLQVFAPISPGLRQLSFSYLLPDAAFPWTIPITDTTTVLEVLVEDPAATVSGAGLEPQASVMLDGRGFQRFLAQDVPQGAVATVTVPAGGVSMRTVYVVGIVGIIGLALLLGLARAVVRPGVPTFRAGAATVDPAERVATEIAALDARFERKSAPTDVERAAWQAERAALKAQLGDILAERDNRL
jgi:hypothetical protein